MTPSHHLQALRLSIFVALVVAAATQPRAARAETGFEAGARLGYGIALGEIAEDIDLSDGIEGQIPIWIDVGYRPIDALMVGLYFQYGIGLIEDEACDLDGVDCSGNDIRLGIQAHYHISPEEQLDPWVGLGIGYEWLNRSVEAMGTEVSSTLEGFEFLNLQAGLDIAVAEHVKLGPFLSFSLGQYGSGSAECSGGACSALEVFGAEADIENKALHQWLVIGARVAYTPQQLELRARTGAVPGG